MLEAVVFLLLIISLLIIIGKIRGNPNPRTMSTAAIATRIQNEEAWIHKYDNQPKAYLDSSLTKTRAAKIQYIKELKTELQSRQPTETLEEFTSKELSKIFSKPQIEPNQEPLNTTQARAILESRFKSEELSERPGFRKKESFFGGVIEVDERSESEKLEAMQAGLAKQFATDIKNARSTIDIDLVSKNILEKISSGKSLGTALYEACISLPMPNKIKKELIAQINKAIESGVNDSDAIRDTLQKFKLDIN